MPDFFTNFTWTPLSPRSCTSHVTSVQVTGTRVIQDTWGPRSLSVSSAVSSALSLSSQLLSNSRCKHSSLIAIILYRIQEDQVLLTAMKSLHIIHMEKSCEIWLIAIITSTFYIFAACLNRMCNSTLV